MDEILWTDDLSVGVERFDTEHKMLLAMLNQLGLALASGQGDEAAPGMAARMRSYAQDHFRTEESAMLSSDYPARIGHIAEHDTFIERVLDLEETLAQGGQTDPQGLRAFLSDWLRSHIMKTDKALGAYLVAASQR